MSYIFNPNLEQFRPIQDFPDYEIGDHGTVRSMKYGKVRVTKPGVASHGYLNVSLCKNGQVKNMTVHRLVAIAFIPNPENKHEVNHLNGKTDNRVCSLEWCNPDENIKHAIKTGLLNNVGENHGKCKVSDTDCELIKIKYATGNYTQKEIGDEFGVSQPQVSYIIRGKSRSNPTTQKTQ